MVLHTFVRITVTALVSVLLLSQGGAASHAQAQDQAAEEAAGPAPLTGEEMEVLVARIALYPDDLVALISSASLYPLQIVEAARFLDDREEDNSLQPKESWDGSVVSLLNYPEIVRMMNDDLEWTQALAAALANQQKDLLVAIQQLRDEAVANGVIKSDDKMEVVEEDDNVVIRSASPEVVYVPQYDPQVLYVPDYPPAPVTYYPDPYPYYYSPTATFFAGAVTGAIWASVIDWDDWGVWGGRWNGGDIDIDCNNCFNDRDFDGKINFNDVDWKNVDRDKINIDKDQFANIDRDAIKSDIKVNTDNSVRNKAKAIKDRPANIAARDGTRDVRKSMQEGLARQSPARVAPERPRPKTPANVSRPSVRPAAKPTKITRPSGNKKPAAKIDRRPSRPSGLGHVSKGKPKKMASRRGGKSMGGGHHGGGRKHKSVKRRR